MRSVNSEKGSGWASPGCFESDAQSMVRPSRRGGVPVFRRPRRKPARAIVADSAVDAFSFSRPAGNDISPICIRPRRKVPVVRTAAPQITRRPSPRMTAEIAPPRNSRSATSASSTCSPRCSRGCLLHGGGIKSSIRLGPRTPHGRPLLAVEKPELDSGSVGDAAHQTVKRIDFPDEMPFAEPADRRIAGHCADTVRSKRDQKGGRAATSRGTGGLAAGVPAADDNYVEALSHELHPFARRTTGTGDPTGVSRETPETTLDSSFT